MLVVGMNPAFNPDEAYPTQQASAAALEDFFENRFRDSDQQSPTWRGIRKIMDELLGRSATPGVDFALTEVVRCKSNKGAGVRYAASTCVAAYFEQTLTLSPAPVVVALGKDARQTLSAFTGTSCELGLTPVRGLAGRDRLIVAVGHPTGLEQRLRLLKGTELALVQQAVASATI